MTINKYQLIANKVWVVGKYEDNKRGQFGLLDISNKIVIDLKFDNWISQINDKYDYIDFIEYPLFISYTDTVHEYHTDSRFDYRDTAHVIHRYSLKDYSFIEKYKVKGYPHEDSSRYSFISDYDYRYKKLYEMIFKKNLEYYKYNSVSILPLTVKEFDELKKSNSSEYKMKDQFNYIVGSRLFAKQALQRKIGRDQAKYNKSEGCYIATMVYKSYDHPDVVILRNFRDNFLMSNNTGRFLVTIYYKYSPKFVEFAKERKWIYLISQKMIHLLVSIIKKGFTIP